MTSVNASEEPVKTTSDVREALDPSLYAPSPEEVAFLKSQTGIQDDEELKQHILAVQREAWEVSWQ